MGKAKQLTFTERVQIDVYHSEGLSYREIAKKIARSFNVVRNYVRNKDTYGKNYKGSTKSALKPIDIRNILRNASNSADSLRKIGAKAGVSVSKTTIWRVINSAKHLKHRKLKKNHHFYPYTKPKG
jgi:transposase